MKTINTIIISGLTVLSLNAPVFASNLESQTFEMNSILENRIEAKIQQISEVVNVELEARVEEVELQDLNSTVSLSDTYLRVAQSKRS